MGAPSGLVSSYGVAFAGLSGRRDSDDTDGALALGMGFGNPDTNPDGAPIENPGSVAISWKFSAKYTNGLSPFDSFLAKTAVLSPVIVDKSDANPIELRAKAPSKIFFTIFPLLIFQVSEQYVVYIYIIIIIYYEKNLY